MVEMLVPVGMDTPVTMVAGTVVEVAEVRPQVTEEMGAYLAEVEAQRVLVTGKVARGLLERFEYLHGEE